jgi:hypothetical protein
MNYREYTSAEEMMAAYQDLRRRVVDAPHEAERKRVQAEEQERLQRERDAIEVRQRVLQERADATVQALQILTAPIDGNPPPDGVVASVILAYRKRRAEIMQIAAVESLIVRMPRDRGLAAAPGFRSANLQPLRDAVVDVTGIPMALILGEGRAAAVVRARYIYVYLLRHFAGYSLPQIGREVGGRDHTTALYGLGRAERAVADGHVETPDENTPEAWVAALAAATWPPSPHAERRAGYDRNHRERKRAAAGNGAGR